MEGSTANFQADVDRKIRGVFNTWGTHTPTNNGDPGACALLIVQSLGHLPYKDRGRFPMHREAAQGLGSTWLSTGHISGCPMGILLSIHGGWRHIMPWDHWTSNPSPVQLWFLTSITANARNLQDWVQARNLIEIIYVCFYFFLIKYKSIILIYLTA